MSAEVWRAVPGYEGKYEVSSAGRVRSLPGKFRSGTVLRDGRAAGGYRTVSLYGGGRRLTKGVHTLVTAAFIGERPSGLVIRHLNGNPADNRVENLAYGTLSENAQDAVQHGVNANAALTHCKRGHAFTPENTRIGKGHRGGERRNCRACQSERQRAWRERRRSELPARPANDPTEPPWELRGTEVDG